MRVVSALAVLAVVAGCGGSAGSSDSGIRGRALIGICAVEQVGMECERPFKGSFEVRQGGELVRTVRTGRDGRFVVELDPGRFVLQTEGALPYLAPTVVVVRPDAFTQVTLSVDSGIR